MSKEILGQINWLGHDGFDIATSAGSVIIDPFQVESRRQADILLITHPHNDHCSIDDITKLIKPSTVIVTEPDSAEKLAVAKITGDTRTLQPGDTLTVNGLVIEAVPAYNTNKKFHPKQNNWLGFIITVDGVRIYHSGDTDIIPEMSALSVDIALLPVSGTYVMTADEAVIAAGQIKPKTAIPMHYNTIVGTDADAAKFKAGLDGVCEVVILEKC